MRIFIGLTEIAGYNRGLSRGLTELAVPNTFFHYGHAFEYEDTSTTSYTPLMKLVRAVARRGRSQTSPPSLLIKLWWRGWHILLKWFLLWECIWRFDVFVFAFGESFFGRHLDLPILKFFRKRIIFVFYGSDSRPPYINGAVMATDRGLTLQECITLTQRIKANVLSIQRYADVIVDHHLSAQFQEKPFVPFLLVGFPCILEDPIRFTQKQSLGKSVRILHAPSRMEYKGTAIIRNTITTLRSKGHIIEYVELSGRPNAEVLNELARCDFVVDELYSDTRMGGLATEAASFKKPAIVCGFACDEKLTIPGVFEVEDFPPVYYCHPDDIETAIEKLVVDETYRMDLGRRAWEFMATQWRPRQVAQRFLWLFQGVIPDEWLFDPQRIRYIHGTGLPATRLKEIVRAVIEVGGVSALCLGDKPLLERALIDLAMNTGNGALSDHVAR